MRRKNKCALFLIMMMVASASVCACGAVEKEEPDVPTKNIEKADDAVDEYNENVEKLNETGNSMDNTQE
jgi:hypothetical protein